MEISEYTPLDALIQQLRAFRKSLSAEACPQVAIRGDDFFGQRLTITYCRELTHEEAELEERYSALSSGGQRTYVPIPNDAAISKAVKGRRRLGVPH
jgi:hypothetical protein